MVPSKIDERVDVVYTGLLTHASREPNAEAEGPPRWVPLSEGPGLKSHSVVMNVRGLYGDEISLHDMADTKAERVSAVYHAVLASAAVSPKSMGKLPHVRSLTWDAAYTLWGYASFVAQGRPPADFARIVYRTSHPEWSGDAEDPEDD